MAIAKVIEISSGSTQSFDDAITQGIKKASESIENIREAWIQDQRVVVEGDKIKEYRVALRITFVVND